MDDCGADARLDEVRGGFQLVARPAPHGAGSRQDSAIEPIFVFMQEVLGPHCAAAETCDVKPRRFLLGQLVQPTCQGVDPGRKQGLEYVSAFALYVGPPPSLREHQYPEEFLFCKGANHSDLTFNL